MTGLDRFYCSFMGLHVLELAIASCQVKSPLEQKGKDHF